MNWLWGQKQVYCLRTQPVGEKVNVYVDNKHSNACYNVSNSKRATHFYWSVKNIVESVNLSPISLNISDSQSKKSFPNISDTFCY